MHCTQKHTMNLDSTVQSNPGLWLLNNVHLWLVRGMFSQRNSIWCSASSLYFISKQAYLVLRKMPTQNVTSSWRVCHNRVHCTLKSAPSKPFFLVLSKMANCWLLGPLSSTKEKGLAKAVRQELCSLSWNTNRIKIFAQTGVAPCIGPLCTAMSPAAC